MKDILLIIDMQNVYKPGQPWGCPNLDSVITNIQNLLSNKEWDSVYFTRHLPSSAPIGTWKTYNHHYDQINASPHLSQIVDELKPYLKQYPVLKKSTYSACPVLPPALSQEPLPQIVLTGVIAQCCILATLLGLIDSGHKIIYLEDAIAGQHTDFEAMTRAIADSFSPLHTQIMTINEYLTPAPPT